MKIKADFVTNSSSASFTMFFRTNDSTLEEFNKRLDKLISDVSYLDRKSLKLCVRMDDHGLFAVEDDTTMYNNNEDIPNYMRSILIEYHMNRSNIFRHGIKEIELDIDHDY